MNAPATASPTASPTASTPQPAAPRRRLLATLGIAALALAGIGLVLYAWQVPPFHGAIERTEDAQVQGQVTLVAPQVEGYVVEVAVQDFQQVRRGQLLARIDDRIYAQQLQQARAQLLAARAELAAWDQQRRGAAAASAQVAARIQAQQAQREHADAVLRRANELAAQRLVSEQDREAALASDRQARADLVQARADLVQARAALQAARENERGIETGRRGLEARVAAAEAAVELARINLDNTRILAPRDGRLGQVGVREGAYVATATTLMALVPDELWVVANFKETQMARVQSGQPVRFTVDALGGLALSGHVERIAPATGAQFSVLPPDNATANFVKIPQRIPVRIGIDPGQEPLLSRLAPGMSVVVAVDTGA
ncbi:HlyD family secretion protein [Pseudoxanthomonas sp. SGNA-20]|uniref:HlyD family secretion protein n=1 Tax=Pseudoxanthomonas sp. SGNA-20 TaxID=2493088 RepID=UPI000F63C9CC|nr:HlyD family secretion protein [Pseudoxanthomonas sp. SGNA-20]RRN59143.1 HlyD family secretion protein [Pseudoxanthomonas sp. SGNA-20]